MGGVRYFDVILPVPGDYDKRMDSPEVASPGMCYGGGGGSGGGGGGGGSVCVCVCMCV